MCFCHAKFNVLIVMSISVMQHELWCTDRDIRIKQMFIYYYCYIY